MSVVHTPCIFARHTAHLQPVNHVSSAHADILLASGPAVLHRLLNAAATGTRSAAQVQALFASGAWCTVSGEQGGYAQAEEAGGRIHSCTGGGKQHQHAVDTSWRQGVNAEVSVQHHHAGVVRWPRYGCCLQGRVVTLAAVD